MKLTNLIDNFCEQYLKDEFIRTLRDHADLRTYLPQIFPGAAAVEDMMTNMRPIPRDKSSDDYTKANLPVHTRNNCWLSKYVERIVKANHADIKRKNITSFVAFDPEFNMERERYEYDVVRAEIKYQMHQQLGQNTLSDEDFRNTIIYNMVGFGIAPHMIVEGLEKNDAMWQIQTAKAPAAEITR